MQNSRCKQTCMPFIFVLLLLVDGVRFYPVSAVVRLNTHSYGKATLLSMHDFLKSYSGLCDRVVMY